MTFLMARSRGVPLCLFPSSSSAEPLPPRVPCGAGSDLGLMGRRGRRAHTTTTAVWARALLPIVRRRFDESMGDGEEGHVAGVADRPTFRDPGGHEFVAMLLDGSSMRPS
jgi:hypothetical protein